MNSGEEEEPRSTSPIVRVAQALRRRLSPPVQPTDTGTGTVPAGSAFSQLLYMGTREGCAEAARASVARATAVREERAERAKTAAPSSRRRGWPGELRRLVSAERESQAEDFFDRLAKAEARVDTSSPSFLLASRVRVSAFRVLTRTVALAGQYCVRTTYRTTVRTRTYRVLWHPRLRRATTRPASP